MIKRPIYTCRVKLYSGLFKDFFGDITLSYSRLGYMNYYSHIATIEIHQHKRDNFIVIRKKYNVPPIKCPENFKYNI